MPVSGLGYLRCMDCDRQSPVTDAVKYGRQWKCRPCHASYRYVRDNDSSWSSMNAEERRNAVLANRCETQRGVTRKLVAQHKEGVAKITRYDMYVVIFVLSFSNFQQLLVGVWVWLCKNVDKCLAGWGRQLPRWQWANSLSHRSQATDSQLAIWNFVYHTVSVFLFSGGIWNLIVWSHFLRSHFLK